jgi:hypothetical protein
MNKSNLYSPTNVSNLGFVILLLAVLACSCPKLGELTGKGNSGTSSNSNTAPFTIKTGEYELTMDKYDQLNVGMARSDVETILGGKGTEVSTSTGGGLTFTVVKWEGENFKTIILTFKNDKIYQKTQVGLDK